MSFSTKASSRTHLWSAASTSLMPAYRKAAVGRFKWKDSLTFDTRFVPGLWPVASEWIWKWGGAIFLVVPLHFFGLKVQLVVSVSAFVMVSTVWPVSCLLFTVHPRALWSRRHCLWLCSGWKWYVIDTHSIDTAVWLWAPTHISPLLRPLSPFFENSSDLHQSQDWPWRRLGGGKLPPFVPRDDANSVIALSFHKCWNTTQQGATLQTVRIL